jgi:tetratricopeptide (TPR) repeat protein
VGSKKNMPEELLNKPSRNEYYFLPLLLGLLGIFYQAQKDIKNFWVVMFLFILTGLAIVVYLNQTPLQPRERDYAYAGSFYAFCIWIGIGVYGIYDSIGKKMQNAAGASAITLLCLVFVPALMAKENWDDHDRSGRYTARDIAANYLNSCAPNAILFTNGDNDTFPLWYAQEVEGIRTDVRVCNLMLLNMDWYIDPMKIKSYESDPLPITLSSDKYLMGTRDFLYITDRIKQYVDIKDVVDFIASDNPQTKLESQMGNRYDYLPTRKLRLSVDSAKVLSNGTVSEKDADKIVSAIEWDIPRNHLGKSELIVMDILAHNNWERPIYYVTTGQEGTLGLDNYMQLDGLAYRLVPIKSPPSSQLNAGRIDTDILYENLMNKFKWGRMNEPDVYLDNYHVKTISIVRMRNRFSRLAIELMNEGKREKAIEVLDRVVELTPREKIPYDNYTIGIAEAYYKCNEIDKANALINEFTEICDRIITYYLEQSKRIIEGSSYEIRYHLQMLQTMVIVTQNAGQTDLSNKINLKLNELYQIYTNKI